MDEDTQLVGAVKPEIKKGTRGPLEFVFHTDYPIGVDGVDGDICLRVFRSKRPLKEEDHRVEIIRKEIWQGKEVAVYRGHPNTDSAQLQFIDEAKLVDAIVRAKGDMEYDQHQKKKRGRPITVASRPSKSTVTQVRPPLPRSSTFRSVLEEQMLLRQFDLLGEALDRLDRSLDRLKL